MVTYTILIKSSDYGSFKYCSKKDRDKDNVYLDSKSLYCKQRGYVWSASNKKSTKLKDKLKEYEDLLAQNKVVTFVWDNVVKLLLSRGIVVTITVNSVTNDIENISFDRSIVSKIYPEVVNAGIINDQRVVFVCSDGKIYCQGGSWKDGYVIGSTPKRKVSLCKDYLVVWGGANCENPQPWSPLIKEHHKGNIHFYLIGAKGPELLASKRTEGDPQDVIISKANNETLIVIEQIVSQKGAVSIEVGTFKLVDHNLKRTCVTLVPLQTQISCCVLSQDEKYVFLGCIDSSIAILNRSRGTTRIAKASFIPTFAIWHIAGVTVAISNEKGQLQYYDVALNCIKSQLIGEDCTAIGLVDLSIYFKNQMIVENLYRGPNGLVVVFEYGPVVVITHVERALSLPSLVQYYLSAEKVDKAIALLLNVDWSDEVFFILQRIIAYLTKLPLTEENARHLQNALGSFHCPPVLLSAEIKRRYGYQVRILTRRYFHQLVRYGMYETAFLLAVDIGHHDLFMDLYYCAVRIGEREMAAAARAQASALMSEYSSEGSCCSRSSCSQCSKSGSICSDEEADSISTDTTTHFEDNNPPRTDGPLITTNDNFLSTNFNNANPQTYANSLRQNVDVPKQDVLQKPPFPKVPPPIQNQRILQNNPILPTQQHFSPLTRPVSQQALRPASPQIVRPVPPPSVPSPTLANRVPTLSGINSSSAFPPPYGNVNRTITTPPLNRLNFSPFNFNSAMKSLPQRPYFRAPSVPISDIRNSPVPRHISTPPLPITNFSLPSVNTNTCGSSVSTTAPPSGCFPGGKKHQAKVKFSDTVTAFIVPEVKRPVRPPPPPHLTNPQKELADSLPLCHPNEDYLKDFTPVRRGESDDGQQSNSQPKIKVVHFGVV
ncbi:WD repeat-containing and planar cell polarity effector protein fritz-like [Agrilus planipennis]|uniref:WD repeat-containing and planar cell polarity effector protein fritz-like n=1 Tax=Agrilus planipennis TaxID=224129 RepID=A0A7F5RL92_AGRPL|nr:WD repeat-containing and planar cell polarity effector protein fritz-like [Agrilus planipennis]